MARKRMIDPSIWQSEDFGKLSNLAKIVFIGLFSLADDEGRGRANPMYLKSNLFPYNEDMRSADIEKALLEISSNMSVIFYSCDGSSYYSLLSWYTFQKIEKPTNSKLPAFDENSKEIHRLFAEASPKGSRPVVPKRKEDNRKEKEEKRIRIKDIYNENCSNLPQVQKLTEKRNKAIDKFLEELTEEQFKILTDAETAYANLEATAEKEAADQKAANAVIALIDAIGNVEYTDASKAKIDEAREAYDKLTDDQKQLVNNYSTLTEAEKRYKELANTRPGGHYKPIQKPVIEAGDGCKTELGINGTKVTITVEGADEDTAAAELETFFKENL